MGILLDLPIQVGIISWGLGGCAKGKYSISKINAIARGYTYKCWYGSVSDQLSYKQLGVVGSHAAAEIF